MCAAVQAYLPPRLTGKDDGISPRLLNSGAASETVGKFLKFGFVWAR